MQVFISHSFNDQGRYKSLRSALKKEGLDCWDVASLRTGARLPDQLRDAIHDSACCIFLATRDSLESEWCTTEIAAFWATGRRILVWAADRDVDQSDLKTHLKGIFFTTDRKKVIADAKDAVERAAPGLELLGPKANVVYKGVVPSFPVEPRKTDPVPGIVRDIRTAAIVALQARDPKCHLDHDSVRANVFVPQVVSGTDVNSGYAFNLVMKRKWSVHMDHAPEWNIRLRPGEGGAGTVFYDQQQRLILRRDLFLRDELKKVVHPDLKWIISTPVKGSEGSSIAVFNIDGLGEMPSKSALSAARKAVRESIGRLEKALDDFPKRPFGLVVKGRR